VAQKLSLRQIQSSLARNQIELSTMTSKGTEKTLQKLKQSVEDGNYYEAHQMYRTVARR
jgi:hypothetical protein